MMQWHNWMYIFLIVSIGFSVIVYLVHKVKLITQPTNKDKHDYVSKYEIKYLQISQIGISLAIFFSANTYVGENSEYSNIWFGVRLVVSMCLGALYGYIAFLILKYYYPAKLNKKLKKYRYMPRTNPETGNAMKLLSEDEEDVYLDEGMQAEENLFSVDYDVWIDPETGTTHIEKYEGRLSALKCDRCGFQTLQLEREEIIRAATKSEDGEIMKHYKCTYCNRVKRKTVNLGRKGKRDNIQLSDDLKFIDPLQPKKNNFVKLVKLDIVDKEGTIRNFEFLSVKEAQRFLKEFDLSKIKEEEF